MLPIASHGTFTIAPKRKKTRKVALSQPLATPSHSAADATQKHSNATLQARSWARRRSSQRSNVLAANANAIRVAAAARAALVDTPRSVRALCERVHVSGTVIGVADRRRIPEATVARLPVYLRLLFDVREAGDDTVSS